ncbi:HopJ type III effector protein [Marinobacter sp. C2H3]|uniref:HopJ type III effector protein n=1 Tax=Marinobacter sp. C2H3 TaxID=3119003 RepID=UPI00300F1CAE
MTVCEAVRIHLASLKGGHARFQDTLALIDRYFDYQPAGFHNGPIYNAAGDNAGSCRVLALGQHCNLNDTDTLRLFAEHHQQVLGDPTGDSHANIRQFMATGWSGVRFDQPPLRARAGQDTHNNTEETP